jgi:hypothetical protein
MIEAATHAMGETTAGVRETCTMVEAATHSVAEAASHAMPKAGMGKTYAAIAVIDAGTHTVGEAVAKFVAPVTVVTMRKRHRSAGVSVT